MRYVFKAVLLSSVLLYSCDPVRTIQVRAKKEDTRILVYLKSQDTQHVGISSVNNPIEVSFKTNTLFSQHFSIGKWDQESIQYLLIDQIDSIVIFSSKNKKFYKTPEALQEYLESKRKIFTKNLIQIER